MKTFNQVKHWAVAALVVPGSIAFAQDKSAAPILPETHGTVVIGDVKGLLENIGALASKVVPGMNADIIKQQAGAMIGDPQLEGFPAGSGVAVIIPKEGMPVVYLEVASKKLEDYKGLLKQRGAGQTADADGLLIVALSESALAGAKELAPQVKLTVLEGSGSPTLSASVKLADILQKYDKQIQAGIASMAEKMEQINNATSNTTTVSSKGVAGIFRGYYALAKKIDTYELSLAPSASGMTITKDITPIDKQPLSAGAGSPEDAAKLVKMLPSSGAMRGYAGFDMEGLGKLVGEIGKEIASDQTEIDIAGIEAWFKECQAVFGGAMAMNFMSDSDSPFAGSFLCNVKDEAAAIKMLSEMPKKLEAIGFNKLYASMGMPITMKFEEKVGTYKDVPLHRLSMTMDFERGSDAQKEQMKKLMGNMVYDIAVVDKNLLYALKPQKVEDLVDAVKAGSHPAAKQLVSEASFPKGGRGYFDYNIGAAMLVAFKMSPMPEGTGKEMVNQMAAAVKDAPPVQIAWYDQGKSYRVMVKLPAEMLKAFVSAGQQAASAKMGSQTSMDAESSNESKSEKPVRSAGPRQKKPATR